VSAQESLRESISLARRVEVLGYHRTWIGENHFHPGLACSAPEILMASILQETSSIRVGSGAVLLSYYSPLKVAEQFATLCALHPDRIDLGIGRATDPHDAVSILMGRSESEPHDRKIGDLLNLLSGTYEKPTPDPVVFMPYAASPDPFILSSSSRGAALAAALGLPLAFAHFSGGNSKAPLLYRQHYRPSARYPNPYVVICPAVVCASTDEEATYLSQSVVLWTLQLLVGKKSEIPDPKSALEAMRSWNASSHVTAIWDRLIHGSPRKVREELDTLVARHEADEIMILTITPDFASRRRSYELIAEAFHLGMPAKSRAIPA